MRLDSLLMPLRHRLRYDPRCYWNNRFRRNGTLSAAGHQRMTATANELAYQADWAALSCILPEAESVLEIGPGTGYYTRRLSGIYADLTSLEVSDVATARLRGQGLNVLRGDICQFNPGRRWDLVLMIEVIQHIVTRQAFAQAMRSLRRIIGDELIIGALCDGRSRRTSFHVHQWTAEQVGAELGIKGERACAFRTGSLWRFRNR